MISKDLIIVVGGVTLGI